MTSRITSPASARPLAALRVLVVDPDVRFRKALRHTLRELAIVDDAGSREEAAAVLARGATYAAFIVEAALPDGSGLAWLAGVRDAHRETSCLVVASRIDRALVNRVFGLGARLHCKPLPFKSLQAFVKDVEARRRPAPLTRSDRIAASVLAWTRKLTPTETRLVGMAVVHTMERREIASELGLSENTVKTHVRSALKKLRAHSIAELRLRAEGVRVRKARQVRHARRAAVRRTAAS